MRTVDFFSEFMALPTPIMNRTLNPGVSLLLIEEVQHLEMKPSLIYIIRKAISPQFTKM